jgi:protein ImuB
MAKPSVDLPFQTALPPLRLPESKPFSGFSQSSLWAAVFFPHLPLEVLRTDVEASPWAVVDKLRGQPQVYAASALARRAGVESGMALTAAHALCPELETEMRDEAAEQACMGSLAEWAAQYSSLVSLESHALLLEVAASLRLFGGVDGLCRQLGTGLARLPHEVVMAMAPTPQAALLLARYGQTDVVTDCAALRAVLGKLPVSVLPVTAKQAALLNRLGLRRLHDLWRLPREGLGKRFGLDLLDYLARLLGHEPEPRLLYHRAPTFVARWPFSQETANLNFILHGLEQLLEQLIHFMRLRELALNRLQIVFYHNRRPPSRRTLNLRQSCRDMDPILSLLRESLCRQQLPASVVELELRVTEFHPFVAVSRSLLTESSVVDERDIAWQQLLDRLQARLGARSISGLQCLADHRPEWAWDYGSPMTSIAAVNDRPLWMLSQPRLLRNSLAGITLRSEAERIEGGWWDGADVRRDYYQAADGKGRRLWLFRDLSSGAWYLHGLFA